LEPLPLSDMHPFVCETNFFFVLLTVIKHIGIRLILPLVVLRIAPNCSLSYLLRILSMLSKCKFVRWSGMVILLWPTFLFAFTQGLLSYKHEAAFTSGEHE
jgi:hypothetical protein